MKFKKLTAALLAVIMCISLASCKSNADSGETSAAFEETTAVTSKSEESTQTTANNRRNEKTETTASKSNIDGIDELNALVEKDVEDTVSALRDDYDQLLSEVGTYEKYLANTDKMEAFYKKVCSVHKDLCIRMREYCIDYVELIINSGKSNYDMYNDLDIMFDNIYSYASDDIYDGVYSGILDDMYDDYYSGILDVDYDDIDDYSEWFDTLSDEYDMWSDTLSEVYDDWSDLSSDVYNFWSDVGSAMYKDDMERVAKKVEKFQEDIDELKGIKTTTPSSEETQPQTQTEKAVTEKTETTAELKGIRPEFKEALDAYEAFFDDYCEIMKQYMENPLDMSLLTKYSEFMEKADEWDEKIEALDDGELSDEELAYYTEVTLRVLGKMLEIYQ